MSAASVARGKTADLQRQRVLGQILKAARLGKCDSTKKRLALARPWLEGVEAGAQRAPAPPGPSGRSVAPGQHRLAFGFGSGKANPEAGTASPIPSTRGRSGSNQGVVARHEAGRRRRGYNHRRRSNGGEPSAGDSAWRARSHRTLTQTARPWFSSPTGIRAIAVLEAPPDRSAGRAAAACTRCAVRSGNKQHRGVAHCRAE